MQTSKPATKRSRSTVSEFQVFTERDPAKIDWASVGRAEIVIESTGLFTKRDDAAKHLHDTVKKVIITAPAKNEDVTVVLGVNEKAYNPRGAPRNLKRVVHDQLPRTDRKSAA